MPTNISKWTQFFMADFERIEKRLKSPPSKKEKTVQYHTVNESSAIVEFQLQRVISFPFGLEVALPLQQGLPQWGMAFLLFLQDNPFKGAPHDRLLRPSILGGVVLLGWEGEVGWVFFV